MEAWDKFIDFLETKYGKVTTDKWARTLKVLRFDACNIFIKSNDFFQTQWIHEYILPLAKEHFLDSNGKFIRIHIDSDEKKKITKIPSKEVAVNFTSDSIFPSATIDKFYPNDENTFSHRALAKLFGYNLENKSLTEIPEENPNPVYIYGPKGSGKTHLLMAAKALLEAHGKNVFYVNADTFTDHVVHAIRFSKMDTFRRTYRNIDALIVDDIEVLSRKSATQEEFFHTFNTLQTSGRMVILSSMFSPRKLEGIEERLVSRFEWGILLSTHETKQKDICKKIMEDRVLSLGLLIDSATKEYLLTNFPSADLVAGAIEALSKSSISDTISLSGVKPVLDKLVKQRLLDGLNSDKVLEEIAKVFGIRVIDMQSKAQTRDCVLPRQFAMFFLRHELKMPFMKIGFIFKKDHSTVMTSIKQIETLIEKNHEETIYYVNAIVRALTKLRNGLEAAHI